MYINGRKCASSTAILHSSSLGCGLPHRGAFFGLDGCGRYAIYGCLVTVILCFISSQPELRPSGDGHCTLPPPQHHHSHSGLDLLCGLVCLLPPGEPLGRGIAKSELLHQGCPVVLSKLNLELLLHIKMQCSILDPTGYSSS